MSAILYRQATEDDLPAVAGMYARLDAHYRQFSYQFPKIENAPQLWVESFRRTLGRFCVLCLAEGENQLLGFVLGRLKRIQPYLGGFLVGELSDVWVEPQARGLGVGEKLNRLTIAWLQQNGARSVEAQILTGNDPIWHLYEKIGFKPELRQVRLLLDDGFNPDA